MATECDHIRRLRDIRDRLEHHGCPGNDLEAMTFAIERLLGDHTPAGAAVRLGRIEEACARWEDDSGDKHLCAQEIRDILEWRTGDALIIDDVRERPLTAQERDNLLTWWQKNYT